MGSKPSHMQRNMIPSTWFARPTHVDMVGNDSRVHKCRRWKPTRPVGFATMVQANARRCGLVCARVGGRSGTFTARACSAATHASVLSATSASRPRMRSSTTCRRTHRDPAGGRGLRCLGGLGWACGVVTGGVDECDGLGRRVHSFVWDGVSFDRLVPVDLQVRFVQACATPPQLLDNLTHWGEHFYKSVNHRCRLK